MTQVPESTYRIQFHANFTFHDAVKIVPYLAALGITHLYASPCLRARAGSTHGYDVTDYNQLNPELGGEEGSASLVACLRQHNMGLILDTVPNHMGVNTNENAWWNDVLENGRGSRHAHFFDIAWDLSHRPHLQGKLLLPILGDHYGRVLESGQLKLLREDGRFALAYYQRRLPVSTESIQKMSRRVVDGGDELASQISANPDLLHELVSLQHYRLAYWRTASDEINYRRFFDVNDLAAMQMERKDVFDATHRLTLKLVHEGAVAGLRIDHPDGLFDPQQYFDRLKSAGVNYVLAEKILAADEPLCRNWAVAGTTGYDALNVINGLFIDQRNAEAFSRLYQRFTGDAFSFPQTARECKLLVLKTLMASELNMLAHMLDRIAQSHRDSQDFTLASLTEALRQLIASFPVYRTYITGDGASARDAQVIDQAIADALECNPELEPSTFEFMRAVLLLQWPAERQQMLRFAGKFQQLTSPVAAKGVEDTALYRYTRLLSLNEVGSDPGIFGTSPARAHEYFSQRQRLWPEAMTTLSTHDTKCSEDVRARLNVLSELPDQWSFHLEQWMRLCDGCGVEQSDLYTLLQAIVGVWPPDDKVDEQLRDRLKNYMVKAMREAKVRSTWTHPNESYESSVADLIDSVLISGEFTRYILPFIHRVARLGVINSLSQTVLKFTASGVADTYQGTELWDFSLVDPDNRRPVDYALRERLLQEAQVFSPSMRDCWQDGRVKLFLTTRLLHLRRSVPGLFTRGEYEPVRVNGRLANHVFAFTRSSDNRTALVAVCRLPASLAEDSWPIGEAVWRDTTLDISLDGDRLEDIFTGKHPGSLKITDVFSDLPVTVLLSS